MKKQIITIMGAALIAMTSCNDSFLDVLQHMIW